MMKFVFVEVVFGGGGGGGVSESDNRLKHP